jgi:hypothetical protein
MKRRFVGAATTAAFVLAAQGAIAAPHRVLDLRNQTDATGEFSVSLCARPSPGPAGIPGHAFVAYSYLPASGGRRQFLALGFTTAASPVQGLLSFSSLLAEPEGFLGEEKFSHVKEQCLVLLVNKAEFDRAYAVALPYGAVPAFKDVRYAARYSLASNDCVTFAVRVAQLFAAGGLKVPERKLTDTPAAYLRRLVDAN